MSCRQSSKLRTYDLGSNPFLACQMNKSCSVCKETKPHSDFYKAKRRPDGVSSNCKKCHDSRNKVRQIANPEIYRALRNTTKLRALDRYNEWKAQQKCTMCPEDDPACLDLHHLDPTEKEATLASVSRSWSWEKMEQEIKKCIVVCRNCHAKIHAGSITVLEQDK